ncbi:MAG: glutamyl-tRNA reductase [Gammaproteobacteria bacterium]
MHLIACGISHQTAPLNIRERLAILPEHVSTNLRRLSSEALVSEATILSTCNRTELYCINGQPERLLNWLAELHQTPANDLEPYIYYYQDKQAVKHLLRVASGLDSMVLGEPQILGQMKMAFHTAVEAGMVGTRLHQLFQYVFSVTKSIRHKTNIGTQAVSIAYTAINLAKQIFANLKNCSVLMIGAGATSELCLRYLSQQNVQSIWIANRTYTKALRIADKYAGQAISLGAISDYIAKADIVITAAHSVLPLVGKGLVERAIKARKHKPMLLLDLAVPRNIEAEVSTLNDVYLYSLDDLQQVIVNNLQNREKAAAHAEKIIDLQVEEYMRWLESLSSISTIRKFRAKIEAIHDFEIHKALQAIQRGHAPEKILRKFANGFKNKIMHTPTRQLRQAGYNKQAEILAAANILFDLEND